MSQRRGGIIQVQVNGGLLEARGNWTYNLGRPAREEILGTDAVHGYTEKAQAPFIEGEITDRSDLDLAAFLDLTDATVTLSLANGKVIALRHAWQAADGTANSEEGNVSVRFVGTGAEEIL
jgi:hypothetical protein